MCSLFPFLRYAPIHTFTMVKLVYLSIFTVSITINYVDCNIRGTLSAYYTSDSLRSFKQEWQHYKRAYEDAVTTNLKEAYGEKSMNVLMKEESNRRMSIAGGFYFSDSSVDVLLYDMLLRDPPNLIMPEVSFDLTSNLLQLEATVSKIFIDTNYYAVRNESAIVYGTDQAGRSPFSLQQVQPYGKLTIIAEDCFMSGFAIATIVSASVNLGHSTFHIADCKFTVEISSNDSSVPPVIAPYFPKKIGQYIEKLLSVPLREQELMPKLQGSMYSFINTTAVFEKELRTYRFEQQRLFKKTSDYLSELCNMINHFTLTENLSSMKMKDIEVRFETKSDSKLVSNQVSLKNMRLYGLDTAYAPRSGGSFEAGDGGLVIAEAIRFSSLQVRGKAAFNTPNSKGAKSGENDFAADLADVAVHMLIMFGKGGASPSPSFELSHWRTADFSVVPWGTDLRLRMGYQAFVTGYLINEVPECLRNHLSKVVTRAVNALDKIVLDNKDDDPSDSDNDDKNKGNNVGKNSDENYSRNDDVIDDKHDENYDDGDSTINNKPMAGNNENVEDFSTQFELSDNLFSDENGKKDILISGELHSSGHDVSANNKNEGGDDEGKRLLVFAPQKSARKSPKRKHGSVKRKSKSRNITQIVTNKNPLRHVKKAMKFKHITFRRDLTDISDKVLPTRSLGQGSNTGNSTPQSPPHMSDNEIKEHN